MSSNSFVSLYCNKAYILESHKTSTCWHLLLFINYLGFSKAVLALHRAQAAESDFSSSPSVFRKI